MPSQHAIDVLWIIFGISLCLGGYLGLFVYLVNKTDPWNQDEDGDGQ